MYEDDEDWVPDNFIYKEINEKTAIQYLLNSFEGKDHYSDLNIFSNVLYGPHYLKQWRKYKGCYALTNFQVKDIELNIIGKPGEIDIMLIPFNDDEIFYHQSAVFEVKILKPKFEKYMKGANSDGFTQTMGLIKAGFPLVGLIHVILSNPLPDIVKKDIQFSTQPFNVDEPGKNKGVFENVEIIKWDWLPFYSANLQMSRLLSYDFPKYVGLKAISLNFTPNDHCVIGFNFDMKDYECGFLNPHRSQDTIDLIKKHYMQYSEKYRKIEFQFPALTKI